MFILLRQSSNAAETLGTAMRLKPITATARRQGHRRKYLPTARPEGEADQYFRTGPTGGRPEQDGRSLPLSPRCRLPLRRVVSESTAPPGRRVRLSSDGGRERDGRHGRPAARVQGAAAGSPRTAGEVCRATGCPTGKGILCDDSQTFPLQVNGTAPPGVSTPGQQVTEAREL